MTASAPKRNRMTFDDSEKKIFWSILKTTGEGKVWKLVNEGGGTRLWSDEDPDEEDIDENNDEEDQEAECVVQEGHPETVRARGQAERDRLKENMR
eukprot:GFUD01113630.1.p1 GENE.GFUD01113630.1~~GFUD01113630.1.p1  ORF type:complete len:110 (+),score=35.52 GFUD01113630.1:43-330(+)